MIPRRGSGDDASARSHRRCAAAGRGLAFVLALLMTLLGAPADAGAHAPENARLRLVELPGDRFAVLWERRPTSPAARRLQPVFPGHCALAGAELVCGDRGLVGRIGFDGLGAGVSLGVFTVRARDGTIRVFTLTPTAPTAEISPQFDAQSWAGRAELVRAYLSIGVEHILLGVDHLLFVLGLLWIARGPWMLFKTITAFTAAHALTLGAVSLGGVGAPEEIVDALIALSIAFIGVEMLHARAGRVTITLRHPWAVAFLFGLLHGFGFTGALGGLGLGEDAVPWALVSFNLGVELGQIGFVLLVLALGWAYRTMRVDWPGWSRAAPAYLIGALGAFWFYERAGVLLWG